MATLERSDSKSIYSWWWVSHISPENSKWLQENLKSIDAAGKQMIKLIEEDADSWIKPEQYYKKRTELVKLVKEVYLAYRALAERYDHATVVMRQVHRTMAEALPHQFPLVFDEDSLLGTFTQRDHHTPLAVSSVIDPNELSKNSAANSSHFHAVRTNGALAGGSGSASSKKGLKQVNDILMFNKRVNHANVSEGVLRKSLGFHGVLASDRSGQHYGFEAHAQFESERVNKTEAEDLALKEALSKLEAEREADRCQYQESLGRLCNLELEVSHVQEESESVNARVNKAEDELQKIKRTLAKLEKDKEASLLYYQQCLDRISRLDGRVAQKDAEEHDGRGNKAESDVESLIKDLIAVDIMKETALGQYRQCMENICVLEDDLKHAEGKVQMTIKRADKAEEKVENLNQEIKKLNEDKECFASEYRQCLEKISSLEHKLSCVQEEAKRLNSEINNGGTKLKAAEEKILLLEISNEALKTELESIALKMGAQSQELIEKQKELQRAWTCLQEEHLRFKEAETAFQKLQHLHLKSQEKLLSLFSELHASSQVLREMETRSGELQEEILKVKEKNKGLNELNISSTETIKNMQDEICGLQETIRKLEAELELHLDQRNALQEELCCSKEELTDLKKKYQNILEQVESVSFSPESFGLSVNELQDEYAKLKEKCNRNGTKKIALLDKLKEMEKTNENLERLSEEYMKNEVLMIEIEDLSRLLSEVKAAYRDSQEEKLQLIEDKKYLARKVIGLEKEKHRIDEDYCATFGDKIYLSNLSLVFKVVITEQFEKLEKLSKNLGSLRQLNISLVKEVKILEGQLEELQMETRPLKDSAVNLENEVISVKLVNDQLTCKMVEGEKLMFQKEKELFRKDEIIKAMHNERKELQISFEEMKREYDVTKTICGDQEKQILILSEGLDYHIKENDSLCGINRNLKTELAKSRKEVEEMKIRQERLECELRKEKDAVQLWEPQAEVFFADLQTFGIHETLFRENIHHLSELYANIVTKHDLKDSEIVLLKKRMSNLEGENKEIKAQLAAYAPLVDSLKDCITYLEHHTLHYGKLKEDGHEETRVSDWAKLCDANSCQQMNDDLRDLRDMQNRIKAIDKAVLEMEKLSWREVSKANDKLEVVMKQIEDLKSGSKKIAAAQNQKIEGGLSNDAKLQKPRPEKFDTGNEVETKDIQLDQISECSSYGRSWRRNAEHFDEIVEFCDSFDTNGSNALTVAGTQRDTLPAHFQRESHHSSEMTVVKEVAVDRLELSNRLTRTNQVKEIRRILEKLNLHAGNLEKLELKVEGLKVMVNTFMNNEKGRYFDYDTIMQQLEEAHEAISKLIADNSSLINKVQNIGSSYLNDAVESDQCRNIDALIFNEVQAASEEFKELQLKVEKIQTLVLGNNKEKARRGATGITGMIRKANIKRRTAPFFPCLQPRTNRN